jgi:hypothetical protein
VTIPTIIEMTMQKPMTTLFGDHPGKQLASGHQKIPSGQYLKNESQQLD